LKKAFFAVLVLSNFVALLVVSVFPVMAQSENSWETKAAMPTARSGFGEVVVNGNIYAIGGWNKNQTDFSDVNEMYNPATDSWTTKASMPTKRVSFATAVYQNKIYVFGGQILVAGHRVVVNVSEVYDPATDTWETIAPVPHLGEDFAANVVVGDKIYAISTYNDVYDPATDTWTTKAQIPEAVAHSANAVVDNKIYVISGTRYGNVPSYYVPLTLTQIYNPETDSWSSGAPIPIGMASPAGVATTGISAPKAIYVVGGLIMNSDGSGGYIYHPQNLVQVYFPENNSWSMGVSMPTARYALSVAAVNDKLYAMGGSDARTSPDLPSNELYLPLGYGTVGQGLPQITIIAVAVVVVVVVAVVAVAFVLRKSRKNKS
jgi:N-acetylneuraminic acid mutarotase